MSILDDAREGMNPAIRITIWVLVLGASTFMAVLGAIGVLVKAGVVS